MSNEEFLRRLEAVLRDRVPQEDVDDAMNYHREYFAEAGENAAESLPAPEAVAEQIVREREEYLRKRQIQWAKPAIIIASAVGILVLVLVLGVVGGKFGLLPSWFEWSDRHDDLAYEEATVTQGASEDAVLGGTAINQIVTTREGSRSSASGELTDVESIVIEGVSDDVFITRVKDFVLDMEYDQREKLSCTVDGGTLYIIGEMQGILSTGYKKGSISITVPEGITLSEIRVTADMGDIYLEDVDATLVELETDLGNVGVSGGRFEKLHCDSDLGDVQASSLEAVELSCTADTGSVEAIDFSAQTTSLEADLGSITAIAKGSQEEYRLELEVDLGEIKVDGQKVSSPYETTRGSRSLEAKADVGNVTLDFAP